MPNSHPRCVAPRGIHALTLTTFRDVPFNAPFYRRLGFDIVTDERSGERLAQLLESERQRGFERRCAIRKPLG
ncbi:hypothetical protein [Halotalea alkalilenta]|uniref:N-acetyltransferase domain-containing protein n=1 Tax=Halotalea alkalilenta TaxID=376489 RepID=A0A172YJA6_9GAMM|nr:hypothetical protein [Halotalea alkalilenta]ANF59290.1 hypothetical protein A5892_19035 [Halotalea alkalilenta]